MEGSLPKNLPFNLFIKLTPLTNLTSVSLTFGKLLSILFTFASTFLTNIDRIPDNVSTVYSLSHHLYPLLQNHGYSGSERTLRNYLQTQPYIRAVFEKHATGDTRIVKELTSSSEMEVL